MMVISPVGMFCSRANTGVKPPCCSSIIALTLYLFASSSHSYCNLGTVKSGKKNSGNL